MNNFNPSKIRALILDMDGVLWRGKQLLGDLPTIFSTIKRKGLGVIMASNNATRTPAQYIKKLHSFGVELDDWQVINSAEATSAYLNQRYPDGGAVYVVGEIGLEQCLRDKGFTISDRDVIAVVAGLDHYLTYEKIATANTLIRQGAEFIGTNPDRTFPMPEGFAPGAGTMLAAIEAASYVKPTIIGKPEVHIFQEAVKRLGTSPEETLMVGDRLETDIAGGQNAGCRTGMVLSGVNTLEEGKNWQPKIDLIADDLTSLVDML